MRIKSRFRLLHAKCAWVVQEKSPDTRIKRVRVVSKRAKQFARFYSKRKWRFKNRLKNSLIKAQEKSLRAAGKGRESVGESSVHGSESTWGQCDRGAVGKNANSQVTYVNSMHSRRGVIRGQMLLNRTHNLRTPLKQAARQN